MWPRGAATPGVRQLAPVVLLTLACERGDPPRKEQSAPPASSASSIRAEVAPLELLYLPDASVGLPPAFGDGLLPFAPPVVTGRCPPEMVDVQGQFCIDRYEIGLIDGASGRSLSPYYHPTRAQTVASFTRYRKLAATHEVTVPEPPAFQLEGEVEPSARSLPDVLPHGYLSGQIAEQACRRAGKRLCAHSEWLLACRGQQRRAFPYGDSYREGACNVFREAHPGVLLRGDASREHLDPRLSLAASERGPLLRRTGATPSCRSEWGHDAIFDLVGNLDEWVAEGFFVGGFYSRATREGCEARIASHPAQYFDYSLGARCCR